MQALPSLAPVQLPNAPQKVRLVSGLTQVPPQFTSPAWHESEQTPALHTSPPEQTVPLFTPRQSPVAPQNVPSVCGSAQVPPQTICEPGHESLHNPSLHTSPDRQAAPTFVPRQSADAPQ
jgi:hypothetical protein